MGGDGPGGYAFGDSAAAARRLRLLAEVFEPTTRAFLGRFAGRRFGLALDLGCGTGHTTRLLAAVLAPRRTLGLDRSPAFVARATADLARPGERDPARPEGPPGHHPEGPAGHHPEGPPEDRSEGPPGRPGVGVGFAVHDVTAVPFPAAPAELVFCRMLLTHLAGPAAVMAAWATQLAPGGLLLVEEVERIHTGQPALRRYLELAAALLAARGHTLEIGPVLAGQPDPPGLARAHDRVAVLAPPAATAAALFGRNLAVWRDQAVQAGLAGDPELDRLAGDLAAVAAGQPATISWELRQLAYRRT